MIFQNTFFVEKQRRKRKGGMERGMEVYRRDRERGEDGTDHIDALYYANSKQSFV